jgi:hypothetical protein
LFPYKSQILQEIEEKQQAKEAEQLRRREEAKSRREGRATENNTVDGSPAGLTDADGPNDQALEADASDEAMQEVRHVCKFGAHTSDNAIRMPAQIQWLPF